MDEIRGRHLIVWSDHKPIIGAFRNPQAMPYDPIAYNQLVEISMWTSDVRYLQAKSNAVADMLSRPNDVPIGAAYALPKPGEDALIDVSAVTRRQAQMQSHGQHDKVTHESSVRHHGTAEVELPSTRGRASGKKGDANIQPHALDSAVHNDLDSALNGNLSGQPLFDAVALQILDHGQLALDQAHCPDVAQHRSGKHCKTLNMTDFQFSQGVWLYCDVSDGKKARPLVPKQHRDLLIKLFHDISHPGFRETLKKLASRYYWPSIRKDVAAYVSACKPCNQCKSQRVIKPPLDTRPTLMPHFHDVQIDIIGPMPQSEGMRYCLTVLDRTLRYFDAIPMANASTTECAQAFIRQWVNHFGLPVQAGSDNGVQFISQLWTELHKELGSIVAYSPLYSSQSLGGG